jgi:hypothetical protein
MSRPSSLRQRRPFNPLLAIGRILIAAGPQVASLTGIGSCDKRPSPKTLRKAIRTVLDKPNYRARVAHG